TEGCRFDSYCPCHHSPHIATTAVVAQVAHLCQKATSKPLRKPPTASSWPWLWWSLQRVLWAIPCWKPNPLLFGLPCFSAVSSLLPSLPGSVSQVAAPSGLHAMPTPN